ncbi:MAG TPA: metalloregulator ArsR/SmtB family transcription factor [Actinomycetota bacterium]|nr:metalloregulator ArsR/SmtB family transcription factor [Actinomycetota bacterium]
MDLPIVCCTPLAGPTLGADEAAATASVFKALADPHRLRIVNLLANSDQPVCVCDITAHLNLTQPTVSFHLKKLTSAGLLDREQRGTWAFYSVNQEALEGLRRVVDSKELVS